MKLKKLLTVLVLGFSFVALVACGQKSPKEIAKNVLKDSYTGYSRESGYENPFNQGNDTLTFDKKNNTITNSQGQEDTFAVLSEEQLKKIPVEFRGTLVTLKDELEGTDNFTIAIGVNENYTAEEAGAYYQIVLSDGGETIRVIELRRGYKEDDAFYDFTGQAD